MRACHVKLKVVQNLSIQREGKWSPKNWILIKFLIALPFVLSINLTPKKKIFGLENILVITDHFQPNPLRLRDWISAPKSTGYEALHVTVMGPEGRWVEVQIRSERMHEIAEKGYAAHFKYKHGKQDERGLEVWLNRLREVIEQPNSDAVDFVKDFRLNLYASEIFVFTPEGDLKSLPQGSTPVDFAFHIHTEIGMHTRGAKINGKIVPSKLSTEKWRSS